MKKFLLKGVLFLSIIFSVFKLSQAQPNCNESCIPCLLGANMGNEDLQAFLKANNIAQIDTVRNLSEGYKIGYSAVNGTINKLYFTSTVAIPDELEKGIIIYFDYADLRKTDKSLPKPKTLDVEKGTFHTRTRNDLRSTAFYKWKGWDKEFYLSRIEIALDEPANHPVERCKYIFRNSAKDAAKNTSNNNVCVEGDCLLCLVNRPVSSAEDLIQLYELEKEDGRNLEDDHYGGLFAPIKIFYDSNKDISKIEIHRDKFFGKLPLDIKWGESRDETMKKLGVKPGNSTFNYYGITVDKGEKTLTLRSNSGFDLPPCEPDKPLAIPKYGCIKGDCENGYGRIRYNDRSHMIVEYEGGFKGGKFHGDGCIIVDGDYDFSYFENGYFRARLKEKLCVDDHCEEPKVETANNDNSVDFSPKPDNSWFNSIEGRLNQGEKMLMAEMASAEYDFVSKYNAFDYGKNFS